MSDSERASVPTGPAGTSVTVSVDQFTQIMQAIESSQRRMDEKFHRFQEEIRLGLEDAAAKALKWDKYEKPYVFRRKGNETQAIFNAKVDEALAQADYDIADIAPGPVESPAISRVRDSIQKGRAIIEERQKLKRLADSS